jgi:cyclopropane fatty-acyl-phospholipid synthase-like methyltransferase
MGIAFHEKRLRLVDRPCNVCDSTRHRPVGLKKGSLTSFDFQIVECTECRFVWVNPGLDDASLLSLYDSDYYRGNGFDPFATYLSSFNAVQDHPCYSSADTAKRISALVHRIGVQGNDLLDVGCGLGMLVGALNKLGFHACGLETSSFAAQKCQSEGLEVVNAQLAERPFGSRKFDVITMIEVIEHVSAPKTLMQQIAPLLKPGGVVYVQTGNVEHAFSLMRRLDRGLKGMRTAKSHQLRSAFSPIMWDYFSPEGHVSYLSPRTLSLLYGQCGLETVQVPRWRNHGGRFPRSLLWHKSMPIGRKPLVPETLP